MILPVTYMWPCQRPQSSAQRTSKLPTCVGSAKAMLSAPGTASALTPSPIAQNEWITSSEVTWNSTSWLTGSTRSADSKSPLSG